MLRRTTIAKFGLIASLSLTSASSLVFAEQPAEPKSKMEMALERFDRAKKASAKEKAELAESVVLNTEGTTLPTGKAFDEQIDQLITAYLGRSAHASYAIAKRPVRLPTVVQTGRASTKTHAKPVSYKLRPTRLGSRTLNK